MRNRFLSFISAACLASICFASLSCPTTALSLPEDCVPEDADVSLAQSGEGTFESSDSEQLPPDSVSFNATIDSSTYEYTGGAITPEVSVSAANGSSLTAGSDYDVSYLNNIAPGCAVISIIGLGDYSGISTQLTFQIVRSANNNVALPGAWVYQNGKW